jgi:hypothetical protein
MDSHSVDRLAMALTTPATRRPSLGLLSAVALLAIGASGDNAAAKKRRKRRRKKKRQGRRNNKRCLRRDATCDLEASPRCCQGLICDRTVVDDRPGAYCCHPEGTTCAAADTCCSGSCDFLVGGGTCSPCRGRTCNGEKPCCGGLACETGFCGGCRDRAVFCSSSAQCCFSDCTSGACLSAQGGKCARDVDCRSCYLSQNCDAACVNGTCAV